MKKPLTIILLLIGEICLANMASPFRAGTFSSSAYTSQGIDILKEKIHIKIGESSRIAFYQIQYFIKTDVDGKQIPLLFLAEDYRGDFKVWVDDQEVKLLNIPEEYKQFSNTPFEQFSNSFGGDSKRQGQESINIFWGNRMYTYDLNDLKYFEIDISKGEHKIRVEYAAYAWTDLSDWVKEYNFYYDLSPAKNWKTFGSMEITLDASSCNSAVKTNLGQHVNGQLDSIAVWNFLSLPVDKLEITYKPQISTFAKTLIAISPQWLTLIFAFLGSIIHFIFIKKYRERYPAKKYSLPVIFGSILIPFLILLSFIISFGVIDAVIGADASNYHGYTFLVILLYPFLLPFYWLIMHVIDIVIKRKVAQVV